MSTTSTVTKPKSPSHIRTLTITYIAMFAVLIAGCSWISIPSVVPFTMQTFAVFLALFLLGGKNGTLAVTVYLLLGAVGAPVFAGFSGGLGVLFGSTGGYLLGFLATALLYWALEKTVCEKHFIAAIAVMVAGLALCYAFGTAWFVFIYSTTTGEVGVGTALAWCVLPYIIPDLGKLAFAYVLAKPLKRHVAL